MSMDIGRILEGWPYNSGQISARRVVGDDGRDKIQLRLDLGLLQMEADGRPDGQRPNGHESLLAYYEQQLQGYQLEHGGSDDGFQLDEQACEWLRNEGTMYYHRYMALLVLEDFEGVERDTLRNLRLFDFCAAYAKEETDKYILEQYRPYVIMMCTRARAEIALRDSRPKLALAVVKRGLASIREFYRRLGQEKAAAASSEVAILKALAKEIEGRIPVDPVQQLKKQLARAVAAEKYEVAASIRDKLARISRQEQQDIHDMEGQDGAEKA